MSIRSSCWIIKSKFNIIDNIKKLGNLDYKYLIISDVEHNLCDSFSAGLVMDGEYRKDVIQNYLKFADIISVHDLRDFIPTIKSVLFEFGISPLKSYSLNITCTIGKNFYDILGLNDYLLSNIDLESSIGYNKRVVYYICGNKDKQKQKIEEILSYNKEHRCANIKFNRDFENFVGSPFCRIGHFRDVQRLRFDLFIRLIYGDNISDRINYKVLILTGDRELKYIFDMTFGIFYKEIDKIETIKC